MIKAINHAIQANNEGVNHLNNGDISEALKSFQAAVATMKKATSVNARPEDSSCSLPCFTQNLQSAPLNGIRDDHCFVYDRPLLMPTKFELSTQREIDAFALVGTAIIIFNFGLACHFYGSQTGKSSTLKQARDLYSLILRLLGSSDCRNDMGTVVACLALNNLAQMHYEACEYESSSICISYLHDLVMSSTSLDEYLCEEEFNEMMLNMMHVTPPLAACAA